MAAEASARLRLRSTLSASVTEGSRPRASSSSTNRAAPASSRASARSIAWRARITSRRRWLSGGSSSCSSAAATSAWKSSRASSSATTRPSRPSGSPAASAGIPAASRSAILSQTWLHGIRFGRRRPDSTAASKMGASGDMRRAKARDMGDV
jgi:hypothetical protein